MKESLEDNGLWRLTAAVCSLLKIVIVMNVGALILLILIFMQVMGR